MNTWENGKNFFLYFMSIMFFSCIINEKKNIEMPKYQLNNKVLVNEILSYIESNNVAAFNQEVMSVEVSQYQDTTIYELTSAISAYGLITTSSTIYLDISGNTVALSYKGVKDIHLPDSLAWQYLKEIFPEEYAYFEKNNDYPPPPTGKNVIWRLTFKGWKLVNKQIISNPSFP